MKCPKKVQCKNPEFIYYRMLMLSEEKVEGICCILWFYCFSFKKKYFFLNCTSTLNQFLKDNDQCYNISPNHVSFYNFTSIKDWENRYQKFLWQWIATFVTKTVNWLEQLYNYQNYRKRTVINIINILSASSWSFVSAVFVLIS